MWPVLRHALAFMENEEGQPYDYVLLPGSHQPGRLPGDNRGAYQQLQANTAADGSSAFHSRTLIPSGTVW